MSPRLQKLLERLPQTQHDLAKRKLSQAIAWGWDEDSIKLVTPEGATPHHVEICGIHPVSLQPTLLPEPE
jgi:hypothetical protein